MPDRLGWVVRRAVSQAALLQLRSAERTGDLDQNGATEGPTRNVSVFIWTKSDYLQKSSGQNDVMGRTEQQTRICGTQKHYPPPSPIISGGM